MKNSIIPIGNDFGNNAQEDKSPEKINRFP